MMSQTGNRSRPRRLQSGFTYIELLIVLVILSIVLSSSVPLFSRTFSRLQLEVFSYKVAKLLDFARNRAVISGDAMQVHFNTRDRKYRLLQAQGDPLNGPFEPVAGRVGLTQIVPDAIVVSSSQPNVTFYPNGAADAFQLFIYDKKRNGYKLTTDVWTGHVRLTRTEED